LDKRPFACRNENGSLLPLTVDGQVHTRRELYCPHCVHEHAVKPCPFRPPAAKRAEPHVRRGGGATSNIFGVPKWNDDQLLGELAEIWRELGRPPSITEVGRRKTWQRRFGSWKSALELASRLLTDEERETLVWRCQHCDKTGFRSARGWQGHERACGRYEQCPILGERKCK